MLHMRLTLHVSHLPSHTTLIYVTHITTPPSLTSSLISSPRSLLLLEEGSGGGGRRGRGLRLCLGQVEARLQQEVRAVRRSHRAYRRSQAQKEVITLLVTSKHSGVRPGRWAPGEKHLPCSYNKDITASRFVSTCFRMNPCTLYCSCTQL
jgi:hypothetical protein